MNDNYIILQNILLEKEPWLVSHVI